ncbi:MAG: hypothetical protein ACXADB_11460 [Candidatus Hermodarchaeia archaeon]|jgi:hypothetical protein
MSEYDLKIIALETHQDNEELQDMAYKLRRFPKQSIFAKGSSRPA